VPPATPELARRTDRAFSLVAAEGPIVIKGRFAFDPALAVGLARLRPRHIFDRLRRWSSLRR